MDRFAAIDVGSNAVRLMVARVEERASGVVIKKEAFLRVPLRLGADVFLHQQLSPALQQKLIQTMSGFQQLLAVFEPRSYRACATSAMRDAGNGAQTLAMVRAQAGIDLQVISGQDEAHMVFSSQLQQHLAADQNYLFIDVGGGSTELLLYCNGRVVCSQSFNVGTVRILSGTTQPQQWQAMQQWVLQHITGVAATAIGSGGNINRLNRIARKEQSKSLSRKMLKRIHTQLSAMTLDQRMDAYDLKPDRADVIVPAALIYLSIMEWGGIETITVPKSGLCDGLIRQQYDEMIARSAIEKVR